MKTTLSWFLLVLLTLPAWGQHEYTARLRVYGAFGEVGVSPAEELWIASRGGLVYHAPRADAPWDVVYPTSSNPAESVSGETFERVTPFSDNVLMISGFIQDKGAQDFVYRSEDRGATWRKVKFGPSSWIDACYATASGKAWMSGSSQLVYYTADSGRSWRHFDKVEKTGTLRFATIHFAPDEQTGLFGALANALYRTRDNCRTWDKLPTPLDQGKYRKVGKDPRPEISKVRIVGDHYVVLQEGRVFLTRTAVIDWQRLPDVVDFEVSGADHLYTVNKDRTVALHDPAFRPQWRTARRMDRFPQALAVRNGKLFAVTHDSVYRFSPGHVGAAALLARQDTIPEPYPVVRHGGVDYGVDGQDLLRYHPSRKQWARMLIAPGPLTHAAVFRGQLLVADATQDRHFAVDTARQRLSPFPLPAQLVGPLVARVASFHLESGSQGCFHADNRRRSYARNGDRFELLPAAQPAPFLNRMDRQLPAAAVEALATELDRSRAQPVAFADLGIAPRDVERFQTFVDKVAERIKKQGLVPFEEGNLFRFPGEYVDFGFYKATAANLAAVPASDLNAAFWQTYGNWSTTRTWQRVIFVLDDGKTLVVENADDRPNYLYAPWTVDYDGLRFRTNSLQFGQLVDRLTQGQFFPAAVRDKNLALFTIANYLYLQKLLADD